LLSAQRWQAGVVGMEGYAGLVGAGSSSSSEGGPEGLPGSGASSCPPHTGTQVPAGAPGAVGTGRPSHLSQCFPRALSSPINCLPRLRGIELPDLCPARTALSASSLALWGQGLAGRGLQTALWLLWRQVEAGPFSPLPSGSSVSPLLSSGSA
jgi:hypothetical protein